MTHSRSAAILLAVAAAVLVAASAESAARETLTEASRASYGYKGGNYKNGGYNMKNKGGYGYPPHKGAPRSRPLSCCRVAVASHSHFVNLRAKSCAY